MLESRPSGLVLPSRRSFLKTSTAAVVGSALAGQLSIARSAHAAGDETIKVGLIGCGGRGTEACAQALRTKGEVKLVAMGDAFGDNLANKLKSLQADDGLKPRIDVPPERQFSGFDAYQKVIDSGVDLVILATPPGFRPIHLAAAVEANKHVFMEKPVAVDGPGVRSVLESVAKAKEKKLAIGVGLQRHHQNNYLETIKRIHDGAIGDVIAMRAYWNGEGVWVRPRRPDQSEMEYQMRNWYYFNWLCGDHIVEQHIHNLDVINWVKGAYPIRANGMGGRQVRVGKEYGEIFDHHYVEFEYADGSRMYSQCRHIPGCWSPVSEHVHGTKGTADVSDAMITPTGGSPWKYEGRRNNPYQTEHDDLFAAIRSGTPYNEGEFGAYSTLTSVLGRMATYNGNPVSWDQALNSDVNLAPKSYSFDAEPPVHPDGAGMYACAIPGRTQSY